MSSWVLLLLASLTAARLWFVRAEGDPFPPSLVELVRSSPISSIEDLQQLLETDSVEEETDEPSANSSNTHGRFARSLVEAQPAQQAVCKVRTEVMEVTRAMLDRRNANFLLWPPCVEVQRCSGCCNTRMLQCVPTVTQTRYLQVTKIQYINKRAHYEKAVISVEDHAGCRCQAHPSASASRTMVQQTPAQNTPPPPPPRLPLVPLPKARSKEELHRHDDLKYNQRFHLEDREQLERQWQSKYTLSHTQPQPQPQPRIHTLAGVHTQGGTHTLSQAQTGGTHTQAGHLPERQDEGYVGGVLSREGGGRETPLAHGSGYEERGSHTRHHTQHHTGEGQHGATTERTLAVERQQQIHQYQQQQQQYQQRYQHNQQQYPQPSQHQYQHEQQQHQQQSRGPTTEDRHLRTQHMHDTPQSDSSSPPDIKTPHDAEQHPHHSSDGDHRLTEQTSEKDSVAKVANMDAQRDTEVTNQRHTETEAIASRQEKDQERNSQTESPNHQHRDSGLTNQERSVTEEERRQKRLEILQREPEDRPQHRHHHPPPPQDQLELQTQPQTTTQSTVWLAPTAPQPPIMPAPPPQRPPFRPALPRRRRKHRNRISKAAIRAMIM